VSETNLPRPENHGSRGGATGGGSREPPRPGHRWLGGLLGLAAVLLAVVLVIILPRLGSAPRGGRPGAASAPATSSASQSVGGLLFVREGVLPGSYDVWIATPDGRGQRDLTRDRASDTDPDWSPDGRRIVYASMPPRCQGAACQNDLYVIDRDGTNRVRLTRTPQDEGDPDWSPDGARIAYTRSDGARSRIWVMRADGSGQRQLTDDPGLAPDWSPDGKRLLYLHVGSGNRPLYTINGDGSARRRLGSVNDVRTARWSPDGTRIALTAHDAVWIVNANGTGLHHIRQSAAYPSWTPDGRHLVFISYASAATGGPELRRMDTEGRNEVVLGGDQADSAPKLR
jgi:Tol biopolymer transport system component